MYILVLKYANNIYLYNILYMCVYVKTKAAGFIVYDSFIQLQ